MMCARSLAYHLVAHGGVAEKVHDIFHVNADTTEQGNVAPPPSLEQYTKGIGRARAGRSGDVIPRAGSPDDRAFLSSRE